MNIPTSGSARRRAKARRRRATDSRFYQCDGTCHDRDEECRRCERLVDGLAVLRIVGCDDCISYAAQDADVPS